ncbi:uncharacterized [Tachysurus ichikawai]
MTHQRVQQERTASLGSVSSPNQALGRLAPHFSFDFEDEALIQIHFTFSVPRYLEFKAIRINIPLRCGQVFVTWFTNPSASPL